MHPDILGVVGPGFLNQVPTLDHLVAALALHDRKTTPRGLVLDPI